MNSELKIIPNFLNSRDFLNIKKTLLSTNFAWYYHSLVLLPDGKDIQYSDVDFQFVHSFYLNYSSNSPYMELLNPVLQKLNPIALVKIKANLITRTNEIVEHGMHTDIPNVKCTTSILYINTCDGYTKFETGEKVFSEENKLVTFPSNLKHTGTTCTDQKCRVVINLNYF